MYSKTVQPLASSKSYKLRGTLVAVDLVHHTIAIQLSEHGWKRARRLMVTPESEILARGERKTLADALVGDRVHAHFTKDGDRAVLKRLHIPRGIAVGHVPQDKGLAGGESERKVEQ
ncbi:MAG: hypothetical protein EPO64_10945 [Nitrospirae bacterium]|nr:MAG: hypothetical protein EPO64_10945 [Nitrospirota bacterium]